MIPMDERRAPEQSELEALLAFDRVLASGIEPTATAAAPFLQPVHECQRLLEAVWPRVQATSLERRNQFGRFSIVRELGRGGFGVVFLAEDSVLRRQVALKVPRPEALVTPEVRRRFLREAEAASRLDHPHIVPVYEVGEEGPICFIASAYCEGPTLANWLRLQTTSVPIRVASRLVAVLAAAVAHAHEREILHRDLKPGNILLQQPRGDASATERVSDELGFIPRICDFGLAKLLDQTSDETRSGVPIGSPVYMAPEQAAGRLREHGPATDVYALGVILYEVLTGRPPHRGESDLETLRLVSDHDPPSPRALRFGLSRDLETIVLKCLEKRPARRYASAGELGADLQRFLDGRPVEARPVPAWEQARKWARRRPVHAALAFVLGAGVPAVLGGLEWARARQKHHNNQLLVALTEARDQRAQFHQQLTANQLRLAGLLVEREEYDPAMSVLETLRPPEIFPDSRGFAWHYLHRQISHGLPMWPPLPERGRAVAHSADGRTFALADDANNTFLMDRDTGTLRELPKPKLTACQRLVFSPDGRNVASLSHGGHGQDWFGSEIKIWDVSSGNPLEGMAQDFGFCYQILFIPHGGTLVTVESVNSKPDKPVRSWRLSGDGKRVSPGESFRANQLNDRLSLSRRADDNGWPPFRFSDVLAVTPMAGGCMAIALESGEIELYRIANGYCIAICRIVGTDVAFVPRIDGSDPYTLAAVDEFGRVARAVTAAAHARPISERVPVLTAHFSRDGRFAAVFESRRGSTRGALNVIDVGTGRAHPDSVLSDVVGNCLLFGFTPRGDALVVPGMDSRARLWGWSTPTLPSTISGHRKELWGLAFSPDGRTLASAGDDHTLKLWDVASGLEQETLEGHGSLVTAVAYSPDGELLASASFDKKIRLWQASSGAPVATWPGHTDHVRAVAFSPDGKTLASAGDDLSIRLWDVATGHLLREPLVGHTGTVFSVVFAPDGKAIYSGSRDGTIRVWDGQDGRLRATWRAGDRVYSLAFSPDGQTLAAAYGRGTICLWHVARQQAGLRLLVGHVGEVLGVAFSPDGRTVASAGRDHSVRLWDPVTGQEVLALKGHAAAVNGIAFSPDGTILATGSHDGAIKLWRASPGLTDQQTVGQARMAYSNLGR
jgi:eukaryotic-like serine/threonine-protein kinase